MKIPITLFILTINVIAVGNHLYDCNAPLPVFLSLFFVIASSLFLGWFISK